MMKHAHMPSAMRGPFTRGFTLIEVLVALIILSVMAATAFKGMDSISRAREVAEGKLKRTLRLQSVMTQFEADMAAVVDVPTLNRGAFEFDGARLRFTRQAPGGLQGVQVVVWNLRNGRWERWAGPVTTEVGNIDTQWKQSYQLQGNEAGTLVALKGVDQWQVYYWANIAGNTTWANAQSTGTVGNQVQAGRVLAPKGIRCVLTLMPASGFEGVITRDVILAPH